MVYLKEIPLWKWMLLLVGSFFPFIIFSQELLGITMMLPSLALKMLAGAVTVVLVMGVYRFAVRKIEKRKVDELAFRHLLRQTAKGFGVGFFMLSLSIGILYLMGYYRVLDARFDIVLFLLPFLENLLVAVGEELAFRGILFRFISMRWNWVAALAVSALLFGFAHAINKESTLWSCIAIAIEAGILLGAAYKFSGSLYFPIGIHWAWNVSEGSVFGSAISGFSPEWSVFVSEISGPEIFTGGTFGVEASVVIVLVCLAVSVYYVNQICR